MPWSIRLAQEKDIAALEELIALSVRALLAPHHSPAVLAACLGPVFERFDAPLPGGLSLPVVRMVRSLSGAADRGT